MKGIDRYLVLAAITNMVIYFPYFFIQGARMSSGIDVHPLAIFPWHIAGMILNLAALVATIRDLYLRHFPNPNSKVTWCLLITWTGGIGWLVYVFKYALKPRAEPSTDAET